MIQLQLCYDLVNRDRVNMEGEEILESFQTCIGGFWPSFSFIVYLEYVIKQ